MLFVHHNFTCISVNSYIKFPSTVVSSNLPTSSNFCPNLLITFSRADLCYTNSDTLINVWIKYKRHKFTSIKQTILQTDPRCFKCAPVVVYLRVWYIASAPTLFAYNTNHMQHNSIHEQLLSPSQQLVFTQLTFCSLLYLHVIIF